LGVDIQIYSMFHGEAEILLRPGMLLEVTGVLDQHDLQIVSLTEVGLSVKF